MEHNWINWATQTQRRLLMEGDAAVAAFLRTMQAKAEQEAKAGAAYPTWGAERKAAFLGAVVERIAERLSQEPTADASWIAHAYPLQQITVQIQGTRRSDKAHMIALLDAVAKRLRAGEDIGTEHDDDFGYVFVATAAADGPSFFDTPADFS